MLTISDEIKTALHDNRPVVALESTLISHGLPYPQNVEIALAMENAVRESGAIPATIAILQGAITVGIGAKAIEYLGSRAGDEVRKCSRRDLPIVVGLKQDGATNCSGDDDCRTHGGDKIICHRGDWWGASETSV